MTRTRNCLVLVYLFEEVRVPFWEVNPVDVYLLIDRKGKIVVTLVLPHLQLLHRQAHEPTPRTFHGLF